MSEVDRLFEEARWEGPDVFASWMALVERPLRASLRRFARAIDVECALQETFMRMWIARRDAERSWIGENASLRFALRVARNVALEDVRRARLDHLVPLSELDAEAEPSIDPPPVLDTGLMRAIKDCVSLLTGKPREALLARLASGHNAHDRDLASALGMAVNTFLQNVVRARKTVAVCLEEKGA